MEKRDFTFTICGTENPLYDKILVNEIPGLYYKFRMYDFYGTSVLHRPKITPYGITEEIMQAAENEMMSWAFSYHRDIVQDMDFGNKTVSEFFSGRKYTRKFMGMSKECKDAICRFSERIFMRDKITDMFSLIDKFGYKFVVCPPDFLTFFGMSMYVNENGYIVITSARFPEANITFCEHEFYPTSKLHLSKNLSEEEKKLYTDGGIEEFSSAADEWIEMFHHDIAFDEHWSMEEVIGNTLTKRRNELAITDEEMKYRLGDKNRKSIIRFEKSNFSYQNAGKLFDYMDVLDLSCAIVKKDRCEIVSENEKTI